MLAPLPQPAGWEQRDIAFPLPPPQRSPLSVLLCRIRYLLQFVEYFPLPCKKMSARLVVLQVTKMALLNMNGSSDPNHRYKMHELQLLPHGKTKHILANLNDVSSDVGRTPELLIAFFNLEVFQKLGLSPCKINKSGDVVAPEGIDQRVLQQKVFEFVRKCVDCPRCHNPETNIAALQGRRLQLHCTACGASDICDQEFTAGFCDWMRDVGNKKHLRTVGERLRVEKMMPKKLDPTEWVFPPTDDNTPSKEEWA